MEIDADKLPPFPQRLPEKLKAIRERLRLTPDETARKVGAKAGEDDILAYGKDDDELPLAAFAAYASLAGVSIENIIAMNAICG